MNILHYLLSILFACDIVLKSANAGDNNDDYDYSNLFPFGSIFSTQHSYNEIKSKNKLRLSKISFEQSLLMDSLGSKIPIGHFKASGAEDLLPCDKLSIVRPELKQHIDCKPIAGHIIDDTFDSIGVDKKAASEPNKLFVRRSTYKLDTSFTNVRPEFRFASLKLRRELLLYPLQEEYALEEVISRGKECDMNDRDFPKNNLNFGHYFEFRVIKLEIEEAAILGCNGYSFLSINETQAYEQNSRDDNYSEFVVQLEYLSTQAINNGYLFSMKNVECSTEESSVFSLNADFTIIQRKKFPYLALKSYVETAPSKSLFNINSLVAQKLNSRPGDPLDYTTEIYIHSNSLIRDLNFELDQVFTNNSTGTRGRAFLSGLSLPIILMEGYANETVLVKELSYYQVDEKDHPKRLLNIIYSDEVGKSATLNIEIDKKGLAESLFGSSKTREKKSLNDTPKPVKHDHIDDFASRVFDEL